MNTLTKAWGLGLVVLMFSGGLLAAQAKLLHLSNADDVRDATLLSQAMEAMSNKVTPCVTQQHNPVHVCVCKYKPQLQVVKKAYYDAVKKHPEWVGNALQFKNSTSQYPQTLYMTGLKASVDMQCN